ncbi:MAG: methyltransferase domain-containing protein [Bacteroidia bacterium]
MKSTVEIQNKSLAAEAFSRQSVVFDDIYSTNLIIQYKRERVRNTVNKHLHVNDKILELNAGTGEDAIYFGQKGYKVHATDIADGMLSTLGDKIIYNKLQDVISSEKCSYTELHSLQNKGPYDLIFSNFAGLNCTDKLNDVLLSFSPLLNKNGKVVLVVMPSFSLWETILAFQGQFKTAFRRFNSKKGRLAHIEGTFFRCWYYNPSYIADTLKDDFEVFEVEGLCSIVPPSFFEGFPKKHPRLYKFLCKAENLFKARWPWKYIGDYFIITLYKK